ncbi:MAG TPA: tyrosine-type recombinase/integrase, partial [Kofleriaceae bacterium]|nr:tyrosine-type recombinase/integrase [Kofleriaceae bacterium]
KLVPLLPVVAESLRAHRLRMVATQHPGLHAGWIFPTEAGGLHKGSPLRKVLDEACAAASVGRRVTPHGLRHTANDLLRRVASAEVTRAIVGHATEQMTHHYSHVDENEKRAAAARVLDVLNGRKGVETGVADDQASAGAPAPEKKNPAGSPG